VKSTIEIKLTTLHLGNCRRVVTIGINGKDPAKLFLEKLRKDDLRKWERLTDRIENVSNHFTYENDQIFNYIEDGIYEFKRPGLRLYAFYDEIGEEHQLILCTNGGKKNNKREQQADIKRAIKIKADYLAAKSSKTARFKITEDP